MATEQEYASSSSGKVSSSSIDPREQWLRQQLPRHLPKRPNDLYIDHNSNFKSQYQRGLGLLGESGWVVVHGLGQAVPHAINLALSLQAAVSSPANLHTNTSSVFLSDDNHTSLTGAAQDYQYARELPVVHIRISLQKKPNIQSPHAKDLDTKGG
ncbi:Ribonuclease P protein subunit p20 [Chionoecetes opilio]|uniref:Ribonuclease P protein subunit p20 n=1 Tax=Chionoecetes opilio TaxID=41210 RepID=A0A8J5D3N5_CHIOP|nr:Ribonuclease P protein subunit p20 [Chionoecetes opilio]